MTTTPDHPARDRRSWCGRPAPVPVYGLIEWDSSQTPTLIVGASPAAVRREAVRLIAGCSADGRIAADDPTFGAAVPGADAPDSAVTAWLAQLREATTVPWFTLYDDADIGAAVVTVAAEDAAPPHRRLIVDG
jgi:hypothetical protein